MRTWGDITLGQFQEITSAGDNELLIMSIILDVSEESLFEIEIDEFKKIYKDFEFLKTPILHNKSFVVDNETFNLIDFEKLTVGEFIDLEHFFSNDVIKNLPIITAILYRRNIVNNDKFLITKLEQYGNYIHHRATIFSDKVSIGDVFGVVKEYGNFRNKIYDVYKGLFNDSEDETEKTFDEMEDEEVEKPIEDKSSKWGWDLILYKLAKENPLKIEEATNIPLIQAMNILSMMKEMNLQ